MHQGRSVRRTSLDLLSRDLAEFPVVALLGPRQCGKTTLARMLADAGRADGRPVLHLDLERRSDRARLTDPEAFLRRHADELVCLDEVQLAPEIFSVLRGLVDEDRRPGRFLLLGSASPTLLRQSSETLAGRLAVRELAPFDFGEVVAPGITSVEALWLRGGFPGSLLASDDDASFRWREQFVRTFLERDIPQLGFRVPSATLGRFWQMCAHLQGQVTNLSALGRAIGTTHTAVRHHLDMLEQTFVVRTLPPLEANLGKRLVKSPKTYLRDSGLLHALLDLDSMDALAGHPVFGASWEGFVIEQVLLATGVLGHYRASYFRTAKGEELDLVLERNAGRGRPARRIAIECKASSAPAVSRGFWTSLRELDIHEAWVISPVDEGYPLGDGAEVLPLSEAIARLG